MLFRLLFSLALVAPASAQMVEEVPFVVTPDHVTLAMLRIAEVGPRDYVIDLGSGDGRIVITAAKRFGARALGIEIVPDLVEKSRAAARGAGVAHRAQFREEDIYKTDLSQATVITMYLLPSVNLQLRPSLLALKPGTRIVSHDWDMGEWRPDRVLTIPVPDKKLGREKVSRVFLWTVPANAQGTWCGAGNAARLDITQSFQDVEGRILHEGRARSFKGSFKGAALQGRKGADARINFEMRGHELVLTSSTGATRSLRGARFVRAVNGICNG